MEEEHRRPGPTSGEGGNNVGVSKESDASLSSSRRPGEGKEGGSNKINEDDLKEEGAGDDQKMAAMPSLPEVAAAGSDALAATDTSNTTGKSTGNGSDGGNNNNSSGGGGSCGTRGEVGAASNSYPTVAVAAAASSTNSGVDDSESPGAKKRLRTAEPETTTATGQKRVSHDDRWIEMFNRLLAYKKKHGRFMYPQK